MKKIKSISLLLAIVTIILSLSACNVVRGASDNTTVTQDDGFKNHMNVKIMVYNAVSYDTDKDEYSVLSEQEPIIGALKGISVGYNDGEAVTPKMVLDKLAAERKATLTYTSANLIDVIEFDKVTYKTDSIINYNRSANKPREADSKDVFPGYYLDMLIWEWTLNGKIVNSVNSTELKEDDNLVLTLKLDNTTEGQNFIFAEDITTAASDNTEAPAN